MSGVPTSQTSYGGRAKKSRTAYKVATVPRPLVTPNGIVVTMPYVDCRVLSSGITNFTYHIYRGASLFDPDFTGVGHQPLGHDQWATLYQRYRVLSSTCVAHIQSLEANTGQDCALAVLETSTGAAGFTDLAEQPYAVMKSTGALGGNSVMMTRNCITKSFEGDPGAAYDKDYTADFGSNPTRDFFFHVGVRNADTNVLTNGAAICVRITYKVLLYDRIDLTQS